MPKAATKKAARKSAKSAAPKHSAIAPAEAVEIPPPAPPSETPPSPSEMKLEPPTSAIETREGVEPSPAAAAPGRGTVNIAALQSMAMPELKLRHHAQA